MNWVVKFKVLKAHILCEKQWELSSSPTRDDCCIFSMWWKCPTPQEGTGSFCMWLSSSQLFPGSTYTFDPASATSVCFSLHLQFPFSLTIHLSPLLHQASLSTYHYHLHLLTTHICIKHPILLYSYPSWTSRPWRWRQHKTGCHEIVNNDIIAWQIMIWRWKFLKLNDKHQ
jgi:hypothetical protein